MLHVGEQCLSEDDALAVVANLIDTMDAEGLPCVSASGAASVSNVSQRMPVTLALSSLAVASRSTAAMVADALVVEAIEIFQPTLRKFQRAMESIGGPDGDGSRASGSHMRSQLHALREMFTAFFSLREVVRAWCRCLEVPEAVATFVLHVRCAIMQPDVLSGDMPRGRRELFSLLFNYGRQLLRDGGTNESSGDEEEVAMLDNDKKEFIAALATDEVLSCLEELGMSRTREIKHLWHSVLVACIADKVDTVEEDFTSHVIQSYLAWEGRVVEPFAEATLSRHDAAARCAAVSPATSLLGRAPRIETGSQPLADGNSSGQARYRPQEDPPAGECSGHESVGVEADRWCSELRERLLVAFARKRIASFWDIMVEYPDSIPALEDLRYCVQRCPRAGIREELTSHLRTLLSTRLHRAGTRTEDILVMLSRAVNALWVLVPRNEQSAVIFSVVSDTLDHLRRRRDCVPAVVQVLTQLGGDTVLHGAYGDVDADAADAGGGGDGTGTRSGRERPDVLRILLTAIPVRALTEEYQHALAQHLLSKDMHDFDSTQEEEVLERLKCVLGGDVMPNCEVMIYDIQSSKRTTNQLRERLSQAISPPILPPQATSLNVLSLTVWPKLSHCVPAGEPALPPSAYKCHPSLQSEMDRLADAYKSLKQGQKLSWMLSQGRVTLDVKQRRSEDDHELVTTSVTLSLFTASAFLFMMELDPPTGTGNGASVATLAARLEVPVDVLLPHLSHVVPSLLVWGESGDAGPGGGEQRVCVQRVLPTRPHVQFGEAGRQSDETQPKSSLDEEQIGLLRTMAVAMLQNGGAASSGDIMNSLKMFTGISLTNADMKHLMHTLVAEGSVVQTDAKTYSVP